MNLITALSWLVSALTGIFVVYVWILATRKPETAIGPGGEAVSSRWDQQSSFLLKKCGPLIELLGEFFALLPEGKMKKNLALKLVRAGNPGGLSVDEFNATRVLATIALIFAGMFIDGELDTSPFLTLAFGILGLYYPNIWLDGYIQKRRRSIFRDLPDLLDILRLCVDAGLDFGSAMTVVVEKGREGPLLSELEKVERDMALGKTRQEALREFANRVAMSEINAFVLALIQADQLGASIGPVLRAQSDMARKRRWQMAEELVNKLPMKMLGPLVVFIFPASFVILFTPLLIQYMQGN